MTNKFVLRLTSVWTMLTRCVLINWTKLCTSMMPSCLACSRLTSTAIYVPVLPTPALENNKQQKKIIYLYNYPAILKLLLFG